MERILSPVHGYHKINSNSQKLKIDGREYEPVEQDFIRTIRSELLQFVFHCLYFKED